MKLQICEIFLDESQKNVILQGLKTKFGFKILTWIESGRIAWSKINHHFLQIGQEMEDNDFLSKIIYFSCSLTPRQCHSLDEIMLTSGLFESLSSEYECDW